MATHPCLVLEAEAGAGKTTRVPSAILDSATLAGEIWVSEPRRLAARLVAHRVASERNEPLGRLIGYTVRFDDRSSAHTRLRYVTSGILLRRLVSDPNLVGIDCVILDEFHERNLDTDLAFAMLIELTSRRPEFRIVIMSATLEGERIARHLDNCPRLYSEGRAFPLTIEHEPQRDDRPLELRVKGAVRSLMKSNPTGSILVFLPGAAEIRKCENALAALCQETDFDLRTLHGDLSLEAQSGAVEPGPRPRVVLSTNVAESSITVEGITSVVDSGTARRLENVSSSGISSLKLVRVSKASATQRAGRAGRIAAGHVIRLYTKGDFESRPEHDVPEILRLDFCEALLLLAGCSTIDVSQLHLLDTPDPTAVAGARKLLFALGAIDATGKLTLHGRRMLGLGLHPRLASLSITCADAGLAEMGALAAALLSERDIRHESRYQGSYTERRKKDVVAGSSDLVELLELFYWAKELKFVPRALTDIGVDARAAQGVELVRQRLLRQLTSNDGAQTRTSNAIDEAGHRETVLAKAQLQAFADRVAKRRASQRPEFVLCSGQLARLAESSVILDATFIVALDVEERRAPGRPPETVIRLASALDPNWLLDVVAEELESDEESLWADPPGRVEVRSRIRLGSLTIEESRRPAKPGPETAQALLVVATERGLLRSVELTSLRVRLALLKEQGLIEELQSDIDTVIETVARSLLLSSNHLDGFAGPTLAKSITESLDPPLPALLRTETPEQVLLPGGRRCVVHYEPQQSPWIESRLQDFFGMTRTPNVLRGRVPLTLHLLAPNLRAVQITNDLQGFWSTHYPSLRRQLMRRYPRHSWPEDGATAAPPEPRPTRQRG